MENKKSFYLEILEDFKKVSEENINDINCRLDCIDEWKKDLEYEDEDCDCR